MDLWYKVLKILPHRKKLSKSITINHKVSIAKCHPSPWSPCFEHLIFLGAWSKLPKRTTAVQPPACASQVKQLRCMSNHRTVEPSNRRTVEPSNRRTVEPSNRRTVEPSNRRTVEPSNRRTVEPSNRRTVEPSNRRTVEPSNRRTVEPSNRRTVEPSNRRTVEPSNHRTIEPSNHRTIEPNRTSGSIGIWPAEPERNPSLAVTSSGFECLRCVGCFRNLGI